jgi:tubulin polyglutamylase TTLL6/13
VQYSVDAGDWDILWTDWHIEPDVLIKMHLFQKISHYPGIHTLARKNLLGMNLMSMREAFPDEYNFFPLTWMLPQEYVEFRTYFESKPKGKARTYIMKPEADCQGRGIFLTRKI